MLKRAHEHKGTSFLEIYQNCNIFNDGAFFGFTEKETKKRTTIFVEHGKPLVFGQDDELGIRLNGTTPEIVKIGDRYGLEDLWIHDEKDPIRANILIRMESLFPEKQFPKAFGVFYKTPRSTYEVMLQQQIDNAIKKNGTGDLDALIAGNETWTIK
jgi:2-oxoglutarate ferredoxin oxidoreductase subunit beta